MSLFCRNDVHMYSLLYMHNTLVHFCVYRCTPLYMHVCMLASTDAKGHLNTELCMYVVQTVQTT